MELNNKKIKFDHNFLDLVFNNTHSYEIEKIESPIEQILLNHLIKYLDDQTEVSIQIPFKTVSGIFRADIVLVRLGRKIILECDGEEFHTKEINEWYDEWRDVLLLKHQEVETIYRIKGKDIYSNINEIIFIISKYDLDFFNPRMIMRILNSCKSTMIEDYSHRKRININYITEFDKEVNFTLEVKRKNLVDGYDSFWDKYVLYSLIFDNKNVKELIEIMKSKHFETYTLLKMYNEKYGTKVTII